MFAVTATLNGLPYTKRLLAALQQPRLAVHTVIVDNGSTDGTPEWIANLRTHDGRPALASSLTLVPLKRNAGVAAAWNLGLRIALQNRAAKILVCGNDTLPMPGTLERLSALIDQGIHFVTGTTVPYDKPEAQIPAAAGRDTFLAAPDFSFFMLTPAVLAAVARADRAIALAHGAAQAVERPAVRMDPWNWGLFDERYFPACYEDNDYFLRMLRAGLIALRDPGAEFRHEASLTVRVNPDVQRQTDEAFTRNAELFKAKWGGLPHQVQATAGSDLRPIVARPPYVTDEQWREVGGCLPIAEFSRERAIAHSRAGLAPDAMDSSAEAIAGPRT